MTLKLYSVLNSPPVRAVILTLKALSIPYDLCPVNFQQGEHLNETYLKLNPQHTVPTIVDEDGFAIWDSHAINGYLVNKYSNYDHNIYPKEVTIRALIDQRLHFDSGVLFSLFRNTFVNIKYKKTLTHATDELKKDFFSAYDFVEKFLDRRPFIAGQDITIADFSFTTTLSTLNLIVPITKDDHPLTTEYLKRCESYIPHYKQLNDEGLNLFKTTLRNAGFQSPTLD